MMGVTEILVRGLCVLIIGAITISIILLVVGETVEHFTP